MHTSVTDLNVSRAFKRLITNLLENCFIQVALKTHMASGWFITEEDGLAMLATANIVAIGL